MKRFLMLIVFTLCVSIPTFYMAGCGKKEAKQEVKEEVMEQTTQDTTAVDTTAAEEAQP